MSVDFAKGGKPVYTEKIPRSQIEIDKSQARMIPGTGHHDDFVYRLKLSKGYLGYSEAIMSGWLAD